MKTAFVAALAVLVQTVAPVHALPGAVAASAPGAEVVIPDAGLRACVTETLTSADHTASDPLRVEDLAALTTLNCNDKSISDLSGLGNAANLTHLYLRDNRISDISPLTGLTALTQLDVGHNRIQDVSSLAGATAITRLDITYNHIADISALAGMSAMGRLSMFENRIADISALAGMTALTQLHASNNQIADVSPLHGLTMLRKLNLAHNRISDVSPLAGLAGMSPLLGAQTLELDEIAQGAISPNPVTDLAGTPAGLTETSDPSLGLAQSPDGLTYSWAGVGVGTATWKVGPFSGTLTQPVTETPARVTASGSAPMAVDLTQGESPTLSTIPGVPTGTNVVGATEITLTNHGSADASVNPVEVPGLKLPGEFTGNDYVGLYLENAATTNILRQSIAGSPGPGLTIKRITVPAGESVTVWAYLWGKQGASSFARLAAYQDGPFDLVFEYRNEGDENLLGTTAVEGNSIAVHDWVSMSGTPVLVDVAVGGYPSTTAVPELGPEGVIAPTKFTLTNPATVETTVTGVMVPDFAVPHDLAEGESLELNVVVDGTPVLQQTIASSGGVGHEQSIAIPARATVEGWVFYRTSADASHLFPKLREYTKTFDLVIAHTQASGAGGQRGAETVALPGNTFSVTPMMSGTEIDRSDDGASTTVLVHGLGDAETERARESRSYRHSDLQPTGRFVRTGQSLSVDVPPGLDSVTLTVGLIGATQAANDGKDVDLTEFPLTPGVNTVTPSMDGMVFLGSTAAAGSARVAITGGQPVPLFVRGRTTTAEFRAELERFPDAPMVEVVSDRMFGDFQRRTAEHMLSLEPVTAHWDEAVRLTNTAWGLLDEPPASRTRPVTGSTSPLRTPATATRTRPTDGSCSRWTPAPPPTCSASPPAPSGRSGTRSAIPIRCRHTSGAVSRR